MGYENARIYKLVCEDGCYYYGSTIDSIQKRFYGHKGSSKTMTSKLYNHIREIGWDKVKIECVEEVSCNNRKELREIENKYILEKKNDPLCLNTLRAYTPDDEKRIMEKERQIRNKVHRAEVVHKYYEEHKDERRKCGKQYYNENKQHLRMKNKEYLEKNKEQVKIQRKKFYDENKERLCKEKREKRQQNLEESKQKMREYRQQNKERINRQKQEGLQRQKLKIKEQLKDQPMDTHIATLPSFFCQKCNYIAGTNALFEQHNKTKKHNKKQVE